MYKAAQRDKPWGDSFMRDVPRDFVWYIEMEARAVEQKIYEPSLVTGLLQNPAYSRELNARHGAPAETAESWLAIKQRRQNQVWSRDLLPSVKVLMGEWALHGAVDDEQRDRLKAADAEVRVLAIADGPFPDLRGAFTLFCLAETDDEPDCLYTEGLEGSQYNEDPETTALYHEIFDRAYSWGTPIGEFEDGHFLPKRVEWQPGG